MMNEFVAKKLGEVLAFIRSSKDTFNRGTGVLTAALGAQKMEDIAEKNRLYSEEIVRIAIEGAVIDTVENKAGQDVAELAGMRDLYLGQNWEEVNEILEWSSFVEGASIAHWALIRGAAESLNHTGLLTLCEEAVNWHYEILEMIESELSKIGQDKAID